MPANRKEVERQEEKYAYLKSKAETLKAGKCGGCFCYHPQDELFCHSTEIPFWACPKGKRPKKEYAPPLKTKPKLGKFDKQQLFPL